MNELQIFAEENHLSRTDTGYAGIYADMFISLWVEAQKLEVRVCADLPRGAKGEKLLEALREKQERYRLTIAENSAATALSLSFEGGDGAIARMERFMSECDVILRPYTREMGILCGKCRREIPSEEKWEAQTVDGLMMPVCEECAKGVSSHGTNRRVANRRRAQRGAVGALTGLLVSAAFYAVLEAMGLGSLWLPALFIGFILNRFYQRFGGIDDKWSMYMLSLCAVFSIILGWIVGDFLSTGVQYARYSGEMEQAESLAQIARSALTALKYRLSVPAFWIYQTLPNMIAAVIGVFVFRRK